MQSTHFSDLFAAMNTAQSFDCSAQSDLLKQYVGQASNRIESLEKREALPIKLAAMIAESLVAWHSDRAAGAPRSDGPFGNSYQSVFYSGGQSLNFCRYIKDYHVRPEMFDGEMQSALQHELESLGVTLKSLSAAPRYANDGPPEFKRMDRPATTTYCQIVGELSI